MASSLTKLSIIGGGSWGTALACVLAPRFQSVRLWVFEPDLAARMAASRVNGVFLPDAALPPNIHIENALAPAVADADVILTAVPSHHLRRVATQLAPLLPPGIPLVSATKGLESGTLLRMSDVLSSTLGPAHPVLALSGPTFAREVAAGKPTAVVLAYGTSRPGANPPELGEPAGCDSARTIQTLFSGPTFRVYTSSDVAGVEIGGALKNVIAIGAGISDGLGLGHNALAALITRGLAELSRLAVALGGRPETLAGLAGLGDLVLTCTGDLSRNRQVGLKLAAGLGLNEIVGATPMVAEGVGTASVALQLAARHGVDLPICTEMYAVLSKNTPPAEAIRRLMSRSLRHEG